MVLTNEEKLLRIENAGENAFPWDPSTKMKMMQQRRSGRSSTLLFSGLKILHHSMRCYKFHARLFASRACNG